MIDGGQQLWRDPWPGGSPDYFRTDRQMHMETTE